MKHARPRQSICLNAILIESGYLSGIGNYTKKIAQHLVRTRPEWDIFLMVHPGAVGNFTDIPGLKIVLVDHASRKIRWLHFFFVMPFRCRKYSLVHSVGNIGILFSFVPQVITLHDVYEHVSPERYGRLKGRLLHLLISIAGRGAAHIITDSLNSRTDIEKYYPSFSKKLSVVYLGTKFPVIRPPRLEGRSGFLVVGTIEPGKNLPLVLEAFAAFHRSQGGRLRIAGSKWQQVPIPDLGALGILDAVEFLGFVPDATLMELYSESLALIQASSYEGFGLPVIEAMACGCPVIAARNSGLIEAGGESALFFKSNDATDLLQKMERIHSDSAVREQCIRSGVEHAARFTWEQAARETGDIYSRYF